VWDTVVAKILNTSLTKRMLLRAFLLALTGLCRANVIQREALLRGGDFGSPLLRVSPLGKKTPLPPYPPQYSRPSHLSRASLPLATR